MALWGGRFSKELDEGIHAFNASIKVDCKMVRQDIEGSLAHAAMLAHCGILTQVEKEQITAGLEGILAELEAGSLVIDEKAEDIHMFVEGLLTQRIGAPGKKLHTARSRNDQVATDLRLYARAKVDSLGQQLKALAQALVQVAEANIGTVMPGYTHLQVAQPVTFGHHLLAYVQMLLRDMTRLEDCKSRMDVLPLGCCALAGTPWPIDREYTAELLGFAQVAQNSLDGVSDRDFCVELACCLALVMTHLSRLCEEVILWCNSRFGFVVLDDAFATGSSIMPQKKNPDIAELVRGKTGRVNGNLVALLTMLKGLPLAYNKDMQEDKEALFDSIETVESCLCAMTPMLLTMEVKPQAMRSAAAEGFINATDCADYLAAKGIPFREAYTLVGRLVQQCTVTGQTLETLPLSDYQSISPVFEGDIYQAISLDSCLAARKSLGGPAPQAVERQLAWVRGQLA